ncbi:hypothetical protein ACFL3V_02965 [Nanoarchaeota archaeon]
MKITKTFLWIAIGLMMLSVVSAVYAYEIDDKSYRLRTSSVVVESADYISFYLTNPSVNMYNLVDLHDYVVEINDVRVVNKFSHSFSEPLPMIGSLDFGDSRLMSLPYDLNDRVSQKLYCGDTVVIEIYNDKGKMVSRWIGVPPCKITRPRADGLMKLGNTTAEYYDGLLNIRWELLGADDSKEEVTLRKTVGNMAPVEGCYDENVCADIIAGKCMTQIQSIVFDREGGASVLLVDKRKGTSVTLSTMNVGSTVCSQDVVVQTTPVTVTAPAPVETAPVEQASEPVPEDNVSVLKANRNVGDVVQCLEGCSAQNQCYDEGSRAQYMGLNVYCKSQSWMVWKGLGKACGADYECSSKICDDVCVDKVVEKKSWVTRLLNWIDNLI